MKWRGGVGTWGLFLALSILLLKLPCHLESRSGRRGFPHGITRSAREGSTRAGGGDGEGTEATGVGKMNAGFGIARGQQQRRPHRCGIISLRGGGSVQDLSTKTKTYEEMMCLHDIFNVQDPMTMGFDAGPEPREEGEAEGAAAYKWRFIAGGWQGWDLLAQHTEFKTSISVFAWTMDACFRFMRVKDTEAKYCFRDASVVDCLWFPPENITGVTQTFEQKSHDLYLVQQLLQDMDEGHGVRIRNHGVDFGLHWRFRALGDYILGTHSELSIEIWLTEQGFVALGEVGVDRGVIVRGGELFEDVSRAEAEAEIAGIADLRAQLLADPMGFEAEFYGPQRDILLERGRLARRERGDCSSDESFSQDTTSDPDWNAPGPVGADNNGHDAPMTTTADCDEDSEGNLEEPMDDETREILEDPYEKDWYGAAVKQADKAGLRKWWDQLGGRDGQLAIEANHSAGVYDLENKEKRESQMRKRAAAIVNKYKCFLEGRYMGVKPLYGSWINEESTGAGVRLKEALANDASRADTGPGTETGKAKAMCSEQVDAKEMGGTADTEEQDMQGAGHDGDDGSL